MFADDDGEPFWSRSVKVCQDGYPAGIVGGKVGKVLRRGERIYEVPISYAGREFAEGKKITWRDGFAAMSALIRYRLRRRV